MTSTTVTSANSQTAMSNGSGQPITGQCVVLTRWAWICIATLAVLFIWLHQPFIERMVRIATNAKGVGYAALVRDIFAFGWNHDWSHVLVIPFIALYYVAQHRLALLTQPTRVYWPGLMLMIAGIFSFTFWIYPGRNDLFQGWSMMAGLAGLVIFILGPSAMKVLWFPIAYLTFAIKMPQAIWDRIAFRLQDFAASVATIALKLIGAVLNFETDKTGNAISITFMRDGKPMVSSLMVAEACAGLRMLMAFVALGVAMAFFSKRALWQKLVLVAATVPIAVAVNVGRVAVLGLLSLISPQFARGDLHIMVGLVVMLPAAALLLLLVGWILDRIFVKAEAEPGNLAELDRPVSVHPSWRGAPQPWRTCPHFSGRLIQGLLGGAAIMFLAVLSAMAALTYFKPALVALVLPVAKETFEPWMALVLAPLAAGLFVAVFLLVRRASHTAAPADPAADPTAMQSRRAFAVAVAAGVLLTGALGFGSMIAAAKVVLFKAPVPLRDQLYRLPQSVRGWEMVGKDEVLAPEIIEALGTNLYISRVYVRQADAAAGLDAAGVRLHVAYYTGTPDTVPHVPDRCFTAGGANGSIDRSRQVTLRGSQYFVRDDESWAMVRFEPYEVRVPETDFDVTCFNYAIAQQHSALAPPEREVRGNVIYFFAANGRFLASPNDVRVQGFDPSDAHAYYCKIEVSVNVPEPERAVQISSEFLSAMMPEILRCLPDWVEVTQGRWPPSPTP